MDIKSVCVHTARLQQVWRVLVWTETQGWLQIAGTALLRHDEALCRPKRSQCGGRGLASSCVN